MFPADTEKSDENELKGAFALPGCFGICLLPVLIRKCAKHCGWCWPEAREHYRSWNTAQKLHPRDEPMQRTSVAPAEGPRTAIWGSGRPRGCVEGLLKMNTIPNSKSGVYICESRWGGVCLSPVSQSDPGRKKILELWESGCRELSLHVRLIKFITWLSRTNPWPFKIVQMPDPPASIEMLPISASLPLCQMKLSLLLFLPLLFLGLSV